MVLLFQSRGLDVKVVIDIRVYGVTKVCLLGKAKMIQPPLDLVNKQRCTLHCTLDPKLHIIQLFIILQSLHHFMNDKPAVNEDCRSFTPNANYGHRCPLALMLSPFWWGEAMHASDCCDSRKWGIAVQANWPCTDLHS